LPWSQALLFDAIIAATDPVAVLATFRTLNADRRLSVLLEGESLLNDGIALVVVAALVDAVGGDARPARIAGTFGYELAGALTLGIVVGFVGHRVIAFARDHLTEMSLSIAIAYGAFLLGDTLHVSAVFTTLSAAVTLGQLERKHGNAFSAEFAHPLHDLRGRFAFLANAALFVLMGMDMRFSVLLNHFRAVLWGIAAALLGRIAVAYGLNRFGFPLHPRQAPRGFLGRPAWRGGVGGRVESGAGFSESRGSGRHDVWRRDFHGARPRTRAVCRKIRLLTTAVPVGLPEGRPEFQSRATLVDWPILCNPL